MLEEGLTFRALPVVDRHHNPLLRTLLPRPTQSPAPVPESLLMAIRPHANEPAAWKVEHDLVDTRELRRGPVEKEDDLDRWQGRARTGRRARDEQRPDERQARSKVPRDESDVGVHGFLPGRSQHFDRRCRPELPELEGEGLSCVSVRVWSLRSTKFERGKTHLLVGLVGVNHVVAGKELSEGEKNKVPVSGQGADVKEGGKAEGTDEASQVTDPLGSNWHGGRESNVESCCDPGCAVVRPRVESRQGFGSWWIREREGQRSTPDAHGKEAGQVERRTTETNEVGHMPQSIHKGQGRADDLPRREAF